MKLGLKDILAVLLAVLATVGIFGMLNAEQWVIPGEHKFDVVLHGVVQYSWAFGWLLVLVAISLILLGWEEKVTTDPDQDE